MFWTHAAAQGIKIGAITGLSSGNTKANFVGQKSLAHRQKALPSGNQRLRHSGTQSQHPKPNPNRTQTMPLAELLERREDSCCLMQVVGNGWGKSKFDECGPGIM